MEAMTTEQLDMDVLPPYLASSSALIKALKASHDPPQPDWPSKIDIARSAHTRIDVAVYRKDALLMDWVNEEFQRVRGAKL